MQFMDKAFDIPVVAQREVPQVHVVKKTVEDPQFEMVHKTVENPETVPQMQVVEKTTETHSFGLLIRWLMSLWCWSCKLHWCRS